MTDNHADDHEGLLLIRNDCAFCHRERSARDDNHAPDCPYWDFFPPATERTPQ